MLDADQSRLIDIGQVTITANGIHVNGFSAENAACRDVAALALVWAIGRIQDELRKTLERPGANNVCVD